MAQVITEDELERILPQKYPFRMIDRVVDFKKDEYLVAEKLITGNEWCFEGDPPLDHFPETLMIEAAAQAVLIFSVLSSAEGKKSSYKLGKINAEMLKELSVGDALILRVNYFKYAGNLAMADVNIKLNQEIIMNCSLVVTQ